jgi:hypothetical protein
MLLGHDSLEASREACMARLSHRQYQLFADCLLKLYALYDDETWHADVADILPTVVRGEGTFCAGSMV